MQLRRVHSYEEQAGVTESASRFWLSVKSETHGDTAWRSLFQQISRISRKI